MAIELKTPNGTGVVSKEQEARLLALKAQKWDVFISNNIFQIIERIYAHLNQNKLPKRAQKIKKPIVVKKSIIEYIEEDDDLEEFNMEGLIDHFEDEDEDEIADGLRSHMQ